MTIKRRLYFSKIYVIESLRSGEVRTGKVLKEDCLYYNSIKLSEMGLEYVYTRCKVDFMKCLEDINTYIVVNNRYPILHIEIHGDKQGLMLESGEFVGWHELKPILRKINYNTRNNLFITLAVCEGAYLVDIITIDELCPYWGILAPNKPMTTGSLAAGFDIFYGEFLQQLDMNKAFEKMKERLNKNTDDSLKLINCELTFYKAFRSYQIHMCSEPNLSNRVNEMYRKLPPELRNRDNKNDICLKLKNVLTGKTFEKEQFIKLKRRFLMIDSFPEIESRFPFGYEDLDKINYA